MQRLLKTPDMSINSECFTYTNVTTYMQFLDTISSHLLENLFIDI